MAIPHTVDRDIELLSEWLNKNVCPDIELLKPQKNEQAEAMNVEYINPTAFPLYIPAKDKLPPDIETNSPGICVQFIQGNDDLIQGTSKYKIRFSFSSWRLGTYIPDEEGDNVFTRNMDGWKDVWRFLELTKTKIQNEFTMDGIRLCREDGMQYAPFSTDGAFPDYHPFWYAWLEASFERGNFRPANKIEEYL